MFQRICKRFYSSVSNNCEYEFQSNRYSTIRTQAQIFKSNYKLKYLNSDISISKLSQRQFKKLLLYTRNTPNLQLETSSQLRKSKNSIQIKFLQRLKRFSSGNLQISPKILKSLKNLEYYDFERDSDNFGLKYVKSLKYLKNSGEYSENYFKMSVLQKFPALKRQIQNLKYFSINFDVVNSNYCQENLQSFIKFLSTFSPAYTYITFYINSDCILKFLESIQHFKKNFTFKVDIGHEYDDERENIILKNPIIFDNLDYMAIETRSYIRYMFDEHASTYAQPKNIRFNKALLLNAAGCGQVSLGMILSNCSNLKGLDLSMTKNSIKIQFDFNLLKKLNQLQIFNFHFNEFQTLTKVALNALKKVATFPNLKQSMIKFYNCHLCDDSWNGLLTPFINSRSLERFVVIFEDNTVKEETISQLMSAIKENQSNITEFCISIDSMKGNSFVELLQKLFVGLTSVEKIDLYLGQIYVKTDIFNLQFNKIANLKSISFDFRGTKEFSVLINLLGCLKKNKKLEDLRICLQKEIGRVDFKELLDNINPLKSLKTIAFQVKLELERSQNYEKSTIQYAKNRLKLFGEKSKNIKSINFMRNEIKF